jgi:hypothetical protein
MKGNESKIAFISFHYLFRIEPFQMVTADSNKKIPPFLNSRLGLRSKGGLNSTQLHSGAQLSPRPLNESSSNICSTYFWFWQANATLKDGRKSGGAREGNGQARRGDAREHPARVKTHVWMPPFAQGVFGMAGRVIGCGHVSGLGCGCYMPRAGMEMRGPGADQSGEL